MNILAVREIEMGKYFTLTKGVNMKKWKIIKIVTIAVLVLLGQPRRFVFRTGIEWPNKWREKEALKAVCPGSTRLEKWEAA